MLILRFFLFTSLMVAMTLSSDPREDVTALEAVDQGPILHRYRRSSHSSLWDNETYALRHPELGNCIDIGCGNEFDGYGVCVDFSQEIDFKNLVKNYQMSANTVKGGCAHLDGNEDCCHCLKSIDPPSRLSLVVIGGDTTDDATTSVEKEGERPSSIPDLPNARWGHSAFVLPDSSDILVCGGYGEHHASTHAHKCDLYNSTIGWEADKATLNLIHPRVHASSVVMESGDILLMGGEYSLITTEVLRRGAAGWEDYLTLEHGISGACAVTTDSHSFVVIGGGWYHDKISVYSTLTSNWTKDWTSLDKGRKGHGCARIGKQVVIAGGYSFEFYKYVGHTLIMDVDTGAMTSNIVMTYARAFFSMQVVHGGILAIGGRTNNDSDPFTSTAEKWIPGKNMWEVSEIQLDTKRSAFASVLLLDYHTNTTTGLSIVHEEEEEFTVVESNLLTTLTTLGKEWRITFDFKPTDYDHNNWTNLIHLTASGNNETVYGDRTPAIFFHPDLGMHVSSAINGNPTYSVDLNQPPKVGEWTTIVMSQAKSTGEEFIFKTEINGTESFTAVNVEAEEFSSVKVYASDPYYTAQPGFIRNLVIMTV